MMSEDDSDSDNDMIPTQTNKITGANMCENKGNI